MEKNKMTKMSNKAILGITLGVAIPFLAGSSYMAYKAYQREQRTPDARMYQQDLNQDGRNGYVVTTKDGKKYTFMAQEDGSYKTLDQTRIETDSVFNANKKSIDSKVR